MAVIGEMDVFTVNKDKQYEVVDRKSRQSIEKINKGVNNSSKSVTAGKVWKSTNDGAGWADSDSMSDNQSGGVDVTINGVKRTLQKYNETSDSMADNESGGVDVTIGGTKRTVAKQADLKEIEKSQNELKGDLDAVDSAVFTRNPKEIFDKNHVLMEKMFIDKSTGEIKKDYSNNTICVKAKANTTYRVQCSTPCKIRVGTLVDYPAVGKFCTNWIANTKDLQAQDVIITSGEVDTYLMVTFWVVDDDNPDKTLSHYIEVLSVLEMEKTSNIETAFSDIKRLKERTAFETIITVAASDAKDEEKAMARYICDGVNDEVEIQAALDVFGYRGELRLSSGTFNIDSFTLGSDGKYRAIRLNDSRYGSIVTWRAIRGVGRRSERCTRIIVTETALNMIPSDGTAMVFSDIAKNNFVYGRGVNYYDLVVNLANNNKPVCVIDNSEFTWGEMDSVSVNGTLPSISNTDETPMPHNKCVGIRGWSGNDSGTNNIMKSCFVSGFYEGYQLGGEHLVGIQINGRYNFYTFTFNNYDFRMGTMSHPMTLINCADEHAARLPYFKKNTYHGESGQAVHQAINLIGYNLEVMCPPNFDGDYVLPAEEEEAGSYRGRIEFTGYGVSNVNGGYGEQSHAQNLVSIKLFKDGHGHGFRTVNLAHKLAGTTAERNTYVPTYMQEYYDTDLHKKLIYDGEHWVDVMGNAV